MIAVDKNMKVQKMQEKPLSNSIYIYNKKKLSLINDYMNHRYAFDAQVTLHIIYVRTLICTHGYAMKKFDIGSLDSYEEAKNYYK